MDKIIKKAVESAEKEFENNKKESKIKKIKEVVKKTLEQIESVDGRLKILQEEKKILKMDIDDLKAGRLDKIEERQFKSDTARHVSVFIVKEKVIKERGTPCACPVYSNQWWGIEWHLFPNWGGEGTLYSCEDTINTTDYTYFLTDDDIYCTATTRDFSNNVGGTYNLTSGTVKYLQ